LNRHGRRRAVVGNDDIVLVAILDPPLAADEYGLGHVLRREGRHALAVPLHMTNDRV
jgi:hypothetical protein